MKLAPSSLAGQFALLLLLAAVLAQEIANALFSAERSERVHLVHRENVIARAGTVARLLREAPPEPHAAILTVASSDGAGFTQTPEPLAFAILLVLGYEDDHTHDEGHEGSHWFAASARLPDGQWLNVAAGLPPAVSTEARRWKICR